MSAACSSPLRYMVLADSPMYLVDLSTSLQVKVQVKIVDSVERVYVVGFNFKVS